MIYDAIYYSIINVRKCNFEASHFFWNLSLAVPNLDAFDRLTCKRNEFHQTFYHGTKISEDVILKLNEIMLKLVVP